MKKLSPDKELELITAYRTTPFGGKRLASQFGVGQATLYRILSAHNIQRDPLKLRRERRLVRFILNDSGEVARRYMAGEKAKDLAREYKCSRWAVIQAIRREGVPVLHQGGQRRKLSDETIRKMVVMSKALVSHADIGRAFRVDPTVVSRVLAEAGLVTGRPTRERHGNWKGGRIQTRQGYVLVRLDPADPFVAMCLQTGYVLEHRYVMAKYLGRPLLPSETVHHIDGDRTNNALDNLQLRIGKHGRGSARQCADCGSHNIADVKLA